MSERDPAMDGQEAADAAPGPGPGPAGAQERAQALELLPTLPTWARRAFAQADRRWTSTFGEGSCFELRQALLSALSSLTSLSSSPADPRATSTKKGPVARARALGREVENAHCKRYGSAALAAELAEQRHRDAAVSDDAALVAYEQKWQDRLRRLQEAHPQRWRVPGLSPDEVRDELTLRLVEAIRSRPQELCRHLRAGKEWGLSFLVDQRRALCKDFKLNVVPVDDFSSVLDRAPCGEQRLIDHEAEAVMALAHKRAAESLSQPQRRWLAAMKMSANAGAFFESSGKPNLAAASRVLGKDRSSAVRAFGELQSLFTRELNKLQ